MSGDRTIRKLQTHFFCSTDFEGFVLFDGKGFSDMSTGQNRKNSFTFGFLIKSKGEIFFFERGESFGNRKGDLACFAGGRGVEFVFGKAVNCLASVALKKDLIPKFKEFLGLAFGDEFVFEHKLAEGLVFFCALDFSLSLSNLTATS